MKNQHLQELVKVLQSVDAPLPLHQEALRKRLFAMSPARKGFRCPLLEALKSGVGSMRESTRCFKIVSVGLAIAVAIVLLGMYMLLPTSQKPPAKQLVAEATAKVLEGSGSATSAPRDGTEYADLQACLKDAQKSADTRVSSVPEVNTLLDQQVQQELKEEHDPAKYVTYTNPADHTIAIALSNQNAPLFALDIEQVAGERADKTPKPDKGPKDKALKRGLAGVVNALGLQ